MEHNYGQLYTLMLEAFDAVKLSYFVVELVYDKKGNPIDIIYRELNPATEKLIGKSREEIVGKSRNELFGTISDEFPNRFCTVLKTGKPEHFQSYGAALSKFYDVFAWKLTESQVAVLLIDITERKEAEESINYNNRRLELLSSVTSRLLSSVNPQSIVQDICREVMTFLNCDVFFNFLLDEEKEILHLNAYSGVPAETAKTFEWLGLGEAVCGCAAQQGERIVCENIPDVQDHRTALVRSFGVKAYCANPIFANGRIIGTLSFGTKKKPLFTDEELSVMRMVTEQVSVAMQRKKAEEEIIRLSTFPELNPTPIIEVDFNGNISYLNASAKVIFSDVPDSGLKHPAFSDWSNVIRLLNADLKGAFYREIRFGGHWFLQQFYLVRGSQRIRIYFADITERMEAQEALKKRNRDLEALQVKLEERASEVEEYATKMEELVKERTNKLEISANYARRLIEASLDPLVTISAEGRITDVNKATEIVTDCSREELIGKDFCSYFTEPDTAEAGYKKAFNEGRVRDYPLAIRSKSGKVTEVLYNAATYYDEAGRVQGIFAAARDITERKALEKQLNEKERLAAIGATAGMVGHDIRNPLQAIASDMYLARSEIDSLQDGETKQNLLDSILETEKNVDYINKIVQDLQDYARPLKSES